MFDSESWEEDCTNQTTSYQDQGFGPGQNVSRIGRGRGRFCNPSEPDFGSTGFSDSFKSNKHDTGFDFSRNAGGDSNWTPPQSRSGDFHHASTANVYGESQNGVFGEGDNDRFSNTPGLKGKSCFKCGEEGHMSRDCPNGGGSRGKSCFKCGEEGHMSRDCPSGGGSHGKSCFKCGEEGHMSRDCPNGGGSRGKSCFKCGEEGHMSRDCPSGGGSHGKSCFKCGEEGHMSRDCPNNGNSNGDNDQKDRPPLYIPPPPPEDEDAIYNNMQRGINFDRYESIPVEVTGEDPPSCIASFDAAQLTEHIRTNVAKANYESPTPVQKYSIPIINANRDLMACAQTGSGKTAAFLLPVLSNIIRNGLESSAFSEKQLPQAIIVGPTRELVYQIFLEARKFSRGTICRPVVAYGGTSVGHQLRELQRGCHVLIATPGRLMDFINKGKVGLESLQYMVLDEADRMLDMGFETEIRRLVDSPGMPSKTERNTLMFSATFPDEIQKLAHDFLREDFLFLTVGRIGGACSDVTQTIIQVDQGDKRTKLLEIVADVNVTRSRTLVFVETKRSADFLACSLSQESYPTTSIHGDRLQQEREEALRDFKEARCPILIATSVAARGLDIPKVEHVINYDLPQEIDEYVHRIGRTGRCGNLGKATTFYDQSRDATLARSLVKILSEAMQEVPSWLESCAESAVGSTFGSGEGGFGGRDTRRGGRRRGGTNQGFGDDNGGFGSRATGDCDYNDGNGFGNSAATGFSAVEEEETWE